MSIRIQDVARAANVSVSTVSRVLNDRYGVAPETYQRVRKVIDDLGYSSSLAARSMRGRTNVIGVITFHLSLSFNTEVIRGIDRVVEAHGYDLMVYTSNRTNHKGDPAWERKVVTQLNGSIVDGMIVLTPLTSNLPDHHPLVVIEPCDEGGFPAVLSTNRAGTREAVEYLINLGHRRIGFLGGHPRLLSARQRRQGYEDAHRQAGLPILAELYAEGNYLREGALTAAFQLLTLPEPPTAIMAANDQSALVVLEVARQLRLRVPQDVSVIGFDNIPESAYTDPPLTTVDQGLVAMGSRAGELLIQRLEGRQVENRLFELPTRLVVRESCRAIPGAT
ncbi:MAG TPA: LacI family DNA-binding transcriptional regulator [Caldilineaceae bacterium]|nr:LacI family DNA-binding transcriptional regulator [Caldilineaceae bacterium]